MGKLMQIAVLTGGMALVNGLAAAALKHIYNENTPYPLPEDFTVTAHAGSLGTEPNTLPSIAAAAESGADVIEFDVNLGADGIPVLSHNKPTGNEPTFESALKFLDMYPHVLVNIDVKNTDVLDKVQEAVLANGVADRVFLTGINAEDVAAVREKSPKIPYYLNCLFLPIGDRKKQAEELADKVMGAGAIGLNPNKLSVTPDLVEVFHTRGLKISAWTVNTEHEMKKLLAMGVDNITTKEPTTLKALLK